MGRAVLMAMTPEFARAAYQRTKRFEYRRCTARIESGDLVILYESHPTKRITGYFTVGRVEHGTSAALSRLESDPTMRSKVSEYLKGARRVTALEICAARQIGRNRLLSEVTSLTRPPQSYCFLEGAPDELLRHLEEC